MSYIQIFRRHLTPFHTNAWW